MAFKPGQSGNIKGRPPSINTAQQLRDTLVKDMPAIIQKLSDLAKQGDTAAAKLLLDRTYPAAKPQALPVNVGIGEGLSQTGGNIINAALSGQIPPDIGAQLITALANLAKVIETDDLLKRIEALEQGHVVKEPA